MTSWPTLILFWVSLNPLLVIHESTYERNKVLNIVKSNSFKDIFIFSYYTISFSKPEFRLITFESKRPNLPWMPGMYGIHEMQHKLDLPFLSKMRDVLILCCLPAAPDHGFLYFLTYVNTWKMCHLEEYGPQVPLYNCDHRQAHS